MSYLGGWGEERAGLRKHIIAEIQRLASESGGKAPGVAAFANATGITQGKWRGVYWARWNDALAEAGFSANALVGKRDSGEVLHKVAELCRLLGRMPTNSDMRLRGKSDPTFPNDKTVASHFGPIANVVAALRKLTAAAEYADLKELLPVQQPRPRADITTKSIDGFVYLLKSGVHYKIGCSANVERRIKEISIALPESTTLVHAIRTDDPSGIEAYWHKRFADCRLNGEWFKLSGNDVKAFRRRSFQ